MKLVWLLFFWLFSAASYAAEGRVFLILSAETSLYQQASQQILQQLPDQHHESTITVLTISELEQQTFSKNDLLVALGKPATEAVQALSVDSPRLYSLVERQDIPSSEKTNWTAVVIDQPFERLLSVAEHSVKNRYHNQIVVAVSATNQRMIDEINAIEPERQPKLVLIDEQQQAARVMDNVLFEAGALIAVRDEQIWSGENAKWMLYQSFKYQVPVIGYSKKFLTAGAFVSVYATLSQTTNTTVNLISDWLNQSPLITGIVFPEFNTEYNEHIARTLNLPVPVED